MPVVIRDNLSSGVPTDNSRATNTQTKRPFAHCNDDKMNCQVHRHIAEHNERGFRQDAPQLALAGLCSGGVGSPVHPFARPPDWPETCENQRKTSKIIGQLPKTTKIHQNHRKTTKNALARSPVAKSGPVGHPTAELRATRGQDLPSGPPHGSIRISFARAPLME